MYFILIIIVIFVLFKIFKGRSESKSFEVDENPYQIRFSVMSKSEEAFFLELTRVLPDDFYLFPKVRIADILKTQDGPGYYVSRNKILPKHVDFLICNSQFRPQMAIEINGISHNRLKTIESDKLKKQIFEEVGFPLRVVKIGESFSGVIQEIIASLNNLPIP